MKYLLPCSGACLGRTLFPFDLTQSLTWKDKEPHLIGVNIYQDQFVKANMIVFHISANVQGEHSMIVKILLCS